MNVEVFCFDACRSREGAWIEIRDFSALNKAQKVAPARERGLKCQLDSNRSVAVGSLP